MKKTDIIALALGIVISALILAFAYHQKSKYETILFRSVAIYTRDQNGSVHLAHCNTEARIKMQYNADTLMFNINGKSVGYKIFNNGVDSFGTNVMMAVDENGIAKEINISNYPGPEGGKFVFFNEGGGVIFLYTLPKCFKI